MAQLTWLATTIASAIVKVIPRCNDNDHDTKNDKKANLQVTWPSLATITFTAINNRIQLLIESGILVVIYPNELFIFLFVSWKGKGRSLKLGIIDVFENEKLLKCTNIRYSRVQAVESVIAKSLCSKLILRMQQNKLKKLQSCKLTIRDNPR